MAEASGVTEDGLKEKITQELQAVHVEIEDMSGISSFISFPSRELIFYPTMTPPFVPLFFFSISQPHSIISLYAELTISKGGCGQAYSAIIVSPLFEKRR
jgi:stress-induced morphogen